MLSGKNQPGRNEVPNAYEAHHAGLHAGVARRASVAHARGLLRTAGTRGLCGGHLGPPDKANQVPSKGRLRAGLPEGEIRGLIQTRSLCLTHA